MGAAGNLRYRTQGQVTRPRSHAAELATPEVEPPDWVQGERGPREEVPRTGIADHFAHRLRDAAKDPRLEPVSAQVQAGEADTREEDVVRAPNPRHLRNHLP